MGLSQDEDLLLPAIRQDLSIHEGGHEMDGSPTWMIYDPVSDNYFKIGWFEFECLQRWDKCQTSSQLRDRLIKETTLRPDLKDINDFIYFLLLSKLLGSHNLAVKNFLETEKNKKKPNILMSLATKYLYFRLPLFRPQHRLQKVYPLVAPLFSKGFFIFTCILLFVAMLITFQRLDEFFLTFTNFFTTESILLILVSTIFIKLVHEMGHAFVAVKYKVPISSMGVAMIVMYPIFYTETTNAWRLYDRRKRMHIAAAGIMAEMFLSAMALLAWNALPPGLLQNLAFYIGFLSLLASVFINMNPLMKFDGYYLLSDYIGIDNLQDRSIAMFKWRLRRALFGFDTDAPESPKTKQGHFLQWFGVSLVIYRFFLYLGIALLVYNLVFKPLGLILFLVEIAWFIALPVFKELAYWYTEREQILQNTRGRFFLLFAILITVVGFLPVNSTIRIPAVAYSGEYFSAYAPVAAQIKQIHVQNNQFVKQGDLLITLETPRLDFSILEAETQIAYFQTIRERLQTSTDLLNEDLTIDQRIAEYETRLDGLNRLKGELTIRAPFSGVIKDMQPSVHVGRWISETEPLMRVVENNTISLHGYVTEDDIDRVSLGNNGRFYSQTSLSDGVDVVITKIAQKDTRDISYTELASVYGGPVPADKGQKGASPTSRRPLYTVDLSIEDKNQLNPFKNNAKQGIIFIEGKSVSIIEKISTEFISLFLREVNL